MFLEKSYYRGVKGQYKVPTSKWVDQKTMVHLHDRIPRSRKKKELLPFVAAWIELKSIMLSEINQ